jgi:RNA polymerase sigma-70 factor (ECF subfamily)
MVTRILEPCGLSFRALQNLSDDLLMAHVSAGHGDALTVLFDRHHRMVFQIALKILRDSGEAEDVMQSVFLEIYRAAAQFDSAKGSTKGWIVQYAYHRSINRRQHLTNRKFYATTELSEFHESLLTREIGPLASQEAAQLVKQALLTLNSTQRRVLEMAYFEGLSMQDIAESTGESVGNVRHHYYRGLKKLKSFLTESGSKQTARYGRKEIADANA